MAQLPDRSVFGNAPSGLSGRVSVDYTGAVAPGRQIMETAARSGEGYKALGAGLERASSAAMAYAKQEEEKTGQLDSAMADATATIHEDNLKQQISNETDPEKIKELLKSIDGGYQSAGSNLSGDHAKLFELKSMHRANRLRLYGEEKIGNLNRDSYMGAAYNTVGELQNAYARGDKQTQFDALDSAGKIFDNMAQNGYITPQKAEEYKHQFTTGAVENFVLNQPVEKQFELLGISNKNVDQATQKGVEFFQSKGWAPHQAAAWMGHFLHESGGRLDPNAINKGDGADGSDSIGIGQWNGKRAQNLKAFAAANGKPWNDLGIQLAFAQHEFETSEKAAADAMRKTGDVDAAVSAGLLYERPKNYQGGLGSAAGGRQRLAYGKRIFSRIGQSGAFDTPSSEGAYEIASASNNPISILSPQDHAKLVNNAFAQRQKELSAQLAQEKLAIQQSQDKFNERLVSNNIGNLLDDIRSDPVLKQHPEQQRQMMDIAQHHISALSKNKGNDYGDGFLAARDAIMSGEINTPRQLYELNQQNHLTVHGVNALKTMMKDLRTDPDKAVEQKIVSAKLKYAASKFIGTMDIAGKNKEIFNGEFVPLFYRRYSAWTKSGKPSDEFLQKENIDKMIKEVADKNQIAANRVVAGMEDNAPATSAAKEVVLPPPSGVDPQKWGSVIANRPFARDGKPISTLNWSQAMKMLAANPTPEMRKAFSKEFNVNADEILAGIGVK